MLSPIMDNYDCFIVTEKTKYDLNISNRKIFYIEHVNRKEILFLLKSFLNSFYSLGIFIKEKPDIIISTGALAMIPICIICKLFGKKLIYIESYAKISSPNITGRILYKFADRFYVQWESMLEYYPKAKFLGGIY